MCLTVRALLISRGLTDDVKSCYVPFPNFDCSVKDRWHEQDRLREVQCPAARVNLHVLLA